MKANVTISRSSDDTVEIRIMDKLSRIEFVCVKMTLEVFGSVITGLSYQEAELEVRGLQWVGKKVVTEPRTIACPLKTHDRKEMSQWLEDNAQEDGWMIESYLGSQGSISQRNEITTLNYRVTKYVDA